MKWLPELAGLAVAGLIKLSYFSTHKFTPQASNFGNEMISKSFSCLKIFPKFPDNNH